ncbi:MAG: hypothetical protein KAT38_03495, partial [Bacteroidales bacterium]|nr:hypothetical protein [Bacteroidales bacterium]
MVRNRCPVYSGMSVRYGQEYAQKSKFKIIDKNCQALTANIGKLGERVKLKVSTQNKYINGLTSWWHRKPSLPIFA